MSECYEDGEFSGSDLFTCHLLRLGGAIIRRGHGSGSDHIMSSGQLELIVQSHGALRGTRTKEGVAGH